MTNIIERDTTRVSRSAGQPWQRSRPRAITPGMRIPPPVRARARFRPFGEACGIRGDWDRARTLMRAMYPALHSMESGDYNQKAKAGCLNATLDAGDARLPLAPLDDAAKQSFRELVRGV